MADMRVKQKGKKRPGMKDETPETTPESASPASPKPQTSGKEKKLKPTQGLRRSSRAAASIMAQKNAKLPATSANNPMVVPDEPVQKPRPTRAKKGDLMDLVDATSKISPEGQSEEPEKSSTPTAEEDVSQSAEGQSEEPEQSDPPEEEDVTPVKSAEVEVEEDVEHDAGEDITMTDATISEKHKDKSADRQKEKSVPKKSDETKKRKRIETVDDEKGFLRSKATGRRVKLVAVKEKGSSSKGQQEKAKKKEIKRGKAKLVDLTPEEIDRLPKFSSETHIERMQTIADMKFTLERGFRDLSKLPPEILQHVEKQGWEPFVVMQPAPVIALVRELYANSEQSTGVDYELRATVRGNEVVLNPKTVHSVNGTHPPEPDTFMDLLKTATKEDLDEALSVVSMPGAQWVDGTKDNLSAFASYLTTKANIWIHFLRNRISSTTHNTLVGQDRVLTVAAIIKGEPIDIAPFIIDSIGIQASKSVGPLFCPSLLSELCKRAGVPFHSDEPKSLTKSYFNIPYLAKRHAQAHARAQGEVPAAEGEGLEALRAELSKIKAKQTKLLKSFKTMHKVLLKVKAQTAQFFRKKRRTGKARKALGSYA